MNLPSPRRSRPAILAAMALALGSPAILAATSNPFPQPIPRGALVADVNFFATIPRHDGHIPRVSQILPAPDGRLFVVDQLGPIYAVSADGTSVIRYLDLSKTAGLHLTSAGSELGFESMAFHPDFLKAGAAGYGKFYTVLTVSDTSRPADFTPGGHEHSDDNVLLEWTTANPSAVPFVPANPASPYREVLRVAAPFSNHTVGLVAFNPNSAAGSADYGKLYVGFGDGGSGQDPLHLAQNPAKPYGKILRLDPLGTNSANGKYGIPADNPFVGVGGATPEIWALGLRNPQRWSWDTGGAHAMFIADIGQGTVEEIDLGVAGANYGWSKREGSYVAVDESHVGANVRSDSASTGFTYPVAEYDHREGHSVTGGFVYRAADLPTLDGIYIFGDIAEGRVFFISGDRPPDGGQTPITELRLRFSGVERSMQKQIDNLQPTSSRVDLRFGMDLAGRIFILNKQDGIIRQMVSPTQASTRPIVQVIGKRKRSSSSRTLRIHGRAAASGGVRTVQVRIGHGSYRPASGKARWHLVLHLPRGTSRVTIRALDRNGTISSLRTLSVRVK